MTKQLLILRGVPGCGKSTFADEWVKQGERRARVNRDDIRMQLFGKEVGVDEVAVTKIEHQQVDTLLKAGYDVVVDDTNIRHAYIKPFVKIGQQNGATVDIKQFDVDVDVAIQRNTVRAALGGRDVPETVIRKMHQSLKSSGPFTDFQTEAVAVTPYVHDWRLPQAVLFDIDGTLATMNDRGPFDWMKVDSDSIRDAVVETARIHYAAGIYVIVMSGRDSACRELTEKWLDANSIPYNKLYMRAEGDMRKDNIVKQELFDTHIRGNFDVLSVYDDRQQVVDMWRSMGLDCFQVQPGDF